MTVTGTGRGVRIVGAVAAAFGILTLLSGGRALFGGVDMGAVVPFVLWFNFLAGAAYLLAGIGLWQRRRWAARLAAAIALASALVLAALGLHVLGGGAYEMRTVAAMTLRVAVWIAIAGYAAAATRRPAVS